MTIGVYDQETGEPLEGAWVSIRSIPVDTHLGGSSGLIGGGEQRTSTGSNGVARLAWPYTDRSSIDVVAPAGCRSMNYHGAWPQALVDGDPKRFEKRGVVRPPALPEQLPDLVFLLWLDKSAAAAPSEEPPAAR